MAKPASQDHHDQGSTPPLTMYVQADAKTFRELVQQLTGPSDLCHHDQICTSSQATERANKEDQVMKGAGAKKLHERRQYIRSKLEIMKPSFQFNLQGSNILFPPVPTNPSSMPHDNSSSIKSPSNAPAFGACSLNSEEEEKAIKERRFYLHPSPRSNKPGVAEPELLTLFPLTSPKTTN